MLIDTAGRYALQESQPEVDAAEWLGFLDLLKKHRGRRALNGVLVAIPVDVLAEGDAAVRAHGREIRKRLAELYDAAGDPAAGLPARHQGRPRQGLRAELRRPRHRRARAGLGRDLRARRAGRTRGAVGARARRAGRAGSRRRVGPRMEAEEDLRDPRRDLPLPGPGREPRARRCGLLVETRLRREPLRGERLAARLLPDLGHPGGHADRPAGRRARLVLRPAGRAASRGAAPGRAAQLLPAPAADRRVFGEAGLATLDPKAEARRIWIWRGAAVGAAGRRWCSARSALTVSYLSNRGAVAAQASEFDRLRSRARPGRRAAGAARAARPRPRARRGRPRSRTPARPLPGAFARARRPLGRAADRGGAGDRLRPQRCATSSSRAWWRCSRRRCGGRSAIPSSCSARSKTYRMMTGLSPMDPGFVRRLVDRRACRSSPPIAALPDRGGAGAPARRHRRACRDDATFIAPDDALVAAALQSVCSIPLAQRAYDALLSDPAATALPDWVPANFAGPNGAQGLHPPLRQDPARRHRRASTPTPASTTWCWRGCEDVAAQAESDRAIFAGGCPESAEASVEHPRPGHAEALQRRLHRPVGRLPARRHAGAADRPRHRQREPQGPRQRRLGAEAAADRRGRRDRPRPPARRRRRAGRAAGGRLEVPRQARQARQARRRRAPSSCPPRRRARRSTPAARRSPTTSSRSRAPSPRWTARRPRSTPRWRRSTALSNQLQTVAASPDPEQAIKEQGGLAAADRRRRQPGGGPARPARRLAARHRRRHHRASPATRWSSQLNAVWAADVLRLLPDASPAAIRSNPSSPSDISGADFARVFGPGQLIDTFTNEQLAALHRHRRRAPGAGAPTSASTTRRSPRSSRRAASATRCSRRRRRPDDDLHARAQGPLAAAPRA